MTGICTRARSFTGPSFTRRSDWKLQLPLALREIEGKAETEAKKTEPQAAGDIRHNVYEIRGLRPQSAERVCEKFIANQIYD